MQARLRSRSFVVALISLAAGVAAAQTPQQTPPAKGTGLLVGQVVDAGTNRPIPAAVVTLTGSGTQSIVLPTGEVIVSSAAPATAPPGAPAAPRQVIVDGAGRFMFRELTRGSYTIRATASGYIAGGFGQNRPAGAMQTVVFEHDDEKRGGLIVRLWQGGSIAGRVIDDLGDPAVNLMIRALRRTFVRGQPRLATFGTATTDDRGVYRFANLVPADYVVAMFSTATTLPASTADEYLVGISSGTETLTSEYSMSGAPFPNAAGFRIGDHIYQPEALGRGGSSAIPPPTEDGRVLAYPALFHPNASAPSQASVITLGSGEDRSGIDLQLRLRRTLVVSGVVTGPDGPVKNVGLKLVAAGMEDMASPTGTEAAVTASDASGAFTFLGVAPGTYTLQCIRVPRTQPPRNTTPMTSIEVAGPGGMIMGMSSSGPGQLAQLLPLPTDPTLWGGLSVTVGETDVRNLSVVLRTGARLSGRIEFEGTSEPPPAEVIQRTNISITSLGAPMPTQVTSGQKRIEADGRFATVGYPPGRYSISATIVPQPPGRPGGTWRLKSATQGGRDLADEGLEVQNTDIGGLVLTFTDRSTEISGTVVDAKGQPDTGAIVVVLPADSQAWKEGILSPRRVRSVRTSTTGAYTFSDLPPGQYFIAAVNDAAVTSWQDPKTLDAISRLASQVTLGDGTKLSQRLTTVTIR